MEVFVFILTEVWGESDISIIPGHYRRLPRPGDHQHHHRQAGREGEGWGPTEAGQAGVVGQLASLPAGRLRLQQGGERLCGQQRGLALRGPAAPGHGGGGVQAAGGRLRSGGGGLPGGQ